MVKLVKQTTSVPCAVGFGISTPEQARKNGRKYLTVPFVGSAIVKLIAEYGTEAAGPVGRYVRKMKNALSLDPA